MTTTTVSAISTARGRIVETARIPTQSLAACYALRKLVAGYAGPCLQVRRSSDSALLDIGFDALDRLDTRALLAFVGFTGDGFVRTWYDQSGGGKHAIQATAGTQPRVVIGGQVQMVGGWPAVKFTYARADILATSSPVATVNSNVSVHAVATGGETQGADGSNLKILACQGTPDFGRSVFTLTATAALSTYLGWHGYNFTDGPPYISVSNGGFTGRSVVSCHTVPGVSSSTLYAYFNGAQASTNTGAATPSTPSGNLEIGGSSSSATRRFQGPIHEILVYNADTRPDRISIEAVQSSFNGHKAAYVPKIQRLLGQTYDSVFAICEILEKLAPVSTQPRVSASALKINGSDFGVYDYVVKRGMDVSLGTFAETAFFSSQQDTRAAFIVIDGNLTIPAGITFTPAVRKLFTVLYVTGNLTLNGTISMTARGSNHSGTGDSAGYVAPQAIRIASSTDIQEENPNLGAATLSGSTFSLDGYSITGGTAYAGIAGTWGYLKAFDKLSTTAWYSDVGSIGAVGTGTAWIQLGYPDTTLLKSYSVTSETAGIPNNFEVWGSNDASFVSGSIKLDEQVFTHGTFGSNTTRSFVVSPLIASYRYYRLYVTNATNNYTRITEWRLYTQTQNPEIPAVGGEGAAAISAKSGSFTTNGLSGSSAVSSGGCGGGGGGGARCDWIAGTHFGGAGSAGTAYSGGSGGGGVWANDGTFVAGSAGANGGAGGDGVRNQRISGALTLTDGSGLGGAGNFGGTSQGPRTTSNSTDGTGGTLIVVVKGTVSGSGTIQSNGVRGGQYTGGLADSWGTSGGGGSGGGSVTLVCGSTPLLAVQANGGALSTFTGVRGGNGGAGGAGSARTFLLPQGSLTTRVPRPVPSTQTALGFARVLRQFGLESAVACAFGLRRLVWNYAGPLVRLRNSSNAELDVYADARTGLLDTNAATTHANGGTLYVVTWYDQSGNGRHMGQSTSTNQPLITLNALGGRPVVAFDGGDYLATVDTGLPTTNYTLFTVTKLTQTPGGSVDVGVLAYGRLGTVGQAAIMAYEYGTNKYEVSQWGSAVKNPSNTLNSWLVSSITKVGNGYDLRVVSNGLTTTTGTMSSSVTLLGTAGSFTLGSFNSEQTYSNKFTGQIAEIVISSSACSQAIRQSIESGQGSHFALS